MPLVVRVLMPKWCRGPVRSVAVLCSWAIHQVEFFLSSLPSVVIRQPVFSNIHQRKLSCFELVNLRYAFPTHCVTSIRFPLAVMCESSPCHFFMSSSLSSQLKNSFLIRAFKVEAYLLSVGCHIPVASGSPNQANHEVLLRHLGNRSECVQRGYLKRG